MPQNNQTLLEKTVADQWQTLPSGLTVIVRPMPGYSSTHVILLPALAPLTGISGWTAKRCICLQRGTLPRAQDV